LIDQGRWMIQTLSCASVATPDTWPLRPERVDLELRDRILLRLRLRGPLERALADRQQRHHGHPQHRLPLSAHDIPLVRDSASVYSCGVKMRMIFGGAARSGPADLNLRHRPQVLQSRLGRVWVRVVGARQSAAIVDQRPLASPNLLRALNAVKRCRIGELSG
jgi:hypothetical protein